MKIKDSLPSATQNRGDDTGRYGGLLGTCPECQYLRTGIEQILSYIRSRDRIVRKDSCPWEEQRGRSGTQTATVHRIRTFMAHTLCFKGHLHSRDFLAYALSVTHSSKYGFMHRMFHQLLKSSPRGIQCWYYNESYITFRRCHCSQSLSKSIRIISSSL